MVDFFSIVTSQTYSTYYIGYSILTVYTVNTRIRFEIRTKEMEGQW
jgi:hypothetical protein